VVEVARAAIYALLGDEVRLRLEREIVDKRDPGGGLGS
jgi:hypothetical protein